MSELSFTGGSATAVDPQEIIQQLRNELDAERRLVKSLRNDISQSRKELGLVHSASEQEEEAVTNRLIARIEELQQEKARIIEQVEKEEEYLTNTLQKKLQQVKKEKVDMENQLEQEQESIVNRLQRQLDALRLQQSVSSSSNDMSLNAPPLSPDIAQRRRSGSHQSLIDIHSMQAVPPVPLIDMLRAEIQGLKFKVAELERDNELKNNQLKEWRTELLMLRQKAGKSVDDLFNESRQQTISGSFNSKNGVSNTPLFAQSHSRTPSDNQQSTHKRTPSSSSYRSTSTGTSGVNHSQYYLGISPPGGRSRTASVEHLSSSLSSNSIGTTHVPMPKSQSPHPH